MKRTDMLFIIEDCLGIPFSEGGDYYSEKILKAIEDAGMLPPSVTKKPTDNIFFDPNQWEE